MEETLNIAGDADISKSGNAGQHPNQGERSMVDKRPRLYYIDNLRTLLMIMVILWHMAVTYGASGFWPYQESQPDDLTGLVFTLFSAINVPYVLGFFLMIAGYFTPGAYDRKGPWLYLKERITRLGIPLLIYVFLFDPLIFYAMRGGGAFWPFWKNHISSYLQRGPGVGPLWFVELLLIFIATYGFGRWVLGLFANKSNSETRPIGRAVPNNAVIAFFALALGMIIFIMRIWLPINSYFKPLGLPMAYVPQYIALFFVGIIAFRGDWFQKITDSTGKVWLRIVLFFILVLFPLVFALGGALEGNTEVYTGGFTWQSFAYATWEEFICMGVIIVLLIWFRRRYNHQGALAEAMSDSTYTVYFIHAPVLVLLALALKDFDLYPLLKWVIISPVGIFLCFMIAYFIKKIPLIRDIL
jgi:surface polysaccharide O-acyltransferase-like enzyme